MREIAGHLKFWKTPNNPGTAHVGTPKKITDYRVEYSLGTIVGGEVTKAIIRNSTSSKIIPVTTPGQYTFRVIALGDGEKIRHLI